MNNRRTTPLYDDNKKTTRIPEFDAEGTQRLRILLLLMAGALLAGGAWLWVNTQRQQQEEIPILARTGEGTPAKPAAPAAGTNAPLTGAQPAGGTQKTEAPSLVPSAAPGSQPPAPVAQELPVAPPAVTGKKHLAATPRLLAANEARAGAGRTDPAARLDNYLPFPRVGPGSPKPEAAVPGPDIPPPPPTKIVPPPPPAALGGNVLAPPPEPDAGLSLAELPAPPARPSIVDKMKLVGIVGERAVIAFSDRRALAENKWPRTITLGRGEQFESVSVVDVSPDSVTFDEDGERSVKSIEPVK
jgi:hypothetical protein